MFVKFTNHMKLTWCYRRIIYQTSKNFHASRRKLVAQVIDGRAIAQTIKEEVKAEVDRIYASCGRRPHLCVILVGDDPASVAYVRNKVEAANYTGISSESLHLHSSISQTELLSLIGTLNKNSDVDGVLVQLPIPDHMDERTICNAVAPHKDVDGFHVLNVGRFMVDQKAFMPATPAGVMEIIRRVGRARITGITYMSVNAYCHHI